VYSKENTWKDEAHPHWTTNGFMWFSNDTWHRYIPETGTYSTLPCKMSDLAKEQCTGSNYAEMDVWASRDGYRWWFHDGADPKGIDSIYCGVRGYNRGGRAYFHWNNDFTSYDVIWRTEWGHGDGMTADGYLMLAELGGHRNIGISYQTRDKLEKLEFNHAGADDDYYNYVPPTPDGIENRNIAHCVNNADLIGTRGFHGENKQPWRSFVWNWRKRELLAEFKDPAPSEGTAYHSVMIAVWEGALPDPHNAKPYIGIDKTELVFTVSGTTQPAAQNVTVTNHGGATLATVTASSDAAWLTATVSGSGSNQIIANKIAVDKLTADESTATVTVSGGGATNSVTYTVVVYKGTALPAPTGLFVEAAGDSLRDVKLAWTDNADGESGYIIERMKEGGSWEEAGRADANATTYTDTHLDLQGSYTYRVKAYKSITGGTEQVSGFSNTANIIIQGIGYIIVTAPTKGQALKTNTPFTITWKTNRVNQVYIEVSYDGGLSWEVITPEGGILEGNGWEYVWTTPDKEITGALLRVMEYESQGGVRGTSGAFNISASAGVKNLLHQSAHVSIRLVSAAATGRTPTGARVEITADSDYSLSLFSASGSRLGTISGRGPRTATMILPALGNGVYMLAGRIGSATISKRLVVHR
jgi:hypothetical protein